MPRLTPPIDDATVTRLLRWFACVVILGIGIAICCGGNSILAGEMVIEWDLVVTFEDGSVIPVDNQTRYRVYVNTTGSGNYTGEGAADLPAGTTGYTFTGLNCQRYWVAVKAFVDTEDPVTEPGDGNGLWFSPDYAEASGFPTVVVNEAGHRRWCNTLRPMNVGGIRRMEVVLP